MDDALRATLAYAARANESLADAIARHLSHQQIYDAALATRAAGDTRGAAELFEQCGRDAEAAACWFEATELKRCIDSASKVAADHALFGSCARLAVQAAVMLDEVPAQLEMILRSWRAHGPRDPHEGRLFLQLGDLFARADRSADARAVYEQVLALDREAATERLARLERAPVVPQRKAAPGRPRQRHDAHEEDPPEPGTLLAGRYHLEDYLGQGGSATVYRAYDLVLGEVIALKLFSGPFDPERQARFKREINVTRRFSHDNIVRIFDLVFADKLQGITMELVEGTTLSDFVRENACSLDARRKLLLQAAAALGYAHARGVIHRDVKPDNMLVAAPALLKVTDFGIAKSPEQTSITMSGTFFGTPYYVAPEQVKSFKNVDRRADIYSLGVVAYELFTGATPFDGRNMLEVLVKHAHDAPARPRSIESRLPEALDELLLQMLAKAPEDRVQSCEEVIARLSALELPT